MDTRVASPESRCSGEQIEKMMAAGFTKEEILRLCGESSPQGRPPSGETQKERTPPGGQRVTLANVLSGNRWVVRSRSLAFASLEAVFDGGGSFAGLMRIAPNDSLHRPGPLNGRWQVAGPMLFLHYVSVMGGQQLPTEHAIEITEASEYRLVGVDKFARLWEFARMNR